MNFDEFLKDIRYIVTNSGESMILCKGDIFWIDSFDDELIVPRIKNGFDIIRTQNILSEINNAILY